MDKVEHLPSYPHVTSPQTPTRNKRFWAFALLAGMLVLSVNLHSALKGTNWKPHTGCGKGRLHMKPRSHYTLPSGDKIPSVALGGTRASSRGLIIWLTSLCLPTLQVYGRLEKEKLARQSRLL